MTKTKNGMFLSFQFTHPGRGATGKEFSPWVSSRSFNSRTPGGVRRRSSGFKPARDPFQFTHPGRGATSEKVYFGEDCRFQFTHPGRGATDSLILAYSSGWVSIHAPREGATRIGLP